MKIEMPDHRAFGEKVAHEPKICAERGPSLNSGQGVSADVASYCDLPSANRPDEPEHEPKPVEETALFKFGRATSVGALGGVLATALVGLALPVLYVPLALTTMALTMTSLGVMVATMARGRR